MKVIKKERLKRAVAGLLVKANIDLREDVMGLLRKALKKETNGRSRFILKSIIGNAVIAKREKIPICQDTGLPVVFIEIGNEVKIEGGDLEGIIDEAIREGTRKGLLRESAVEPIFNRRYTSKRAGVIHLKMAQGDKLKLTVLPKGFGCENKTSLKMFKPTAALSKIENFVVDSVKSAGADACPPFVVGSGIGGTAEKACLLAKEALL
jgi:fumarate hydratase subunit alpha